MPVRVSIAFERTILEGLSQGKRCARVEGRRQVGLHAPRTEKRVTHLLPRAAVRAAAAALVLGCLGGSPGSAFAGWQLAWSDEFSGTNVDSTKWTFDTGNGSGGWGNNELEYYTTRATNVYVSNGLLNIVARKESYKGFNYTSAKLKTLGLFSTLYGRFEFRVKQIGRAHV